MINPKYQPLLTLQTYNGVPDPVVMENWRSQLEGFFEKKTRYAVITDLTDVRTPDKDIKNRESEWIKQHKPELKEWCIGLALVVPSSVIRIALNAVFWVSPLPHPYAVVSNFGEAYDWIEAALLKEGIPMPVSREACILEMKNAQED